MISLSELFDLRSVVMLSYNLVLEDSNLGIKQFTVCVCVCVCVCALRKSDPVTWSKSCHHRVIRQFHILHVVPFIVSLPCVLI